MEWYAFYFTTATFKSFTGPIPYDGITMRQDVSIHPALSSIYMILASTGIVFAVICLIFNYSYRKTKYAVSYRVKKDLFFACISSF